MENVFNLRRFLYLMRREEAMNWRSILLAALTLGGVTALLTLLGSLQGETAEMHRALFIGFLFLGGYITASGAFREMHQRAAVHDWLMLPASSEEKFLDRVIVSSVGYWLFISVVYFLGMLAGEGLSFIISGRGGDIFNPFALFYLRLFPHYLISQSIFIAGGAFFRKHSFLKTVLFLSLFGIVVGFFTLLAARLVFSEYFSGGVSFDFTHQFGNAAFPATRTLAEILFRVVGIIYYGLLAPFCWIAAYLRVREAEVRYAV